MSTSTSLDEVAPREAERNQQRNWPALLFWLAVLALVSAAVAMRLYGLGLPFDRDGYDEGVYWQSLRAMSAGHGLYGDIFYSQPPFFLLSTYPLFALFGGTLWSARLGIALVSLIGLLGALLLGKALSGRPGALAALLLVIVNPLYLAQSQTIQAEAPSAAFELLAIGLALYWCKYPDGRRGVVLAMLTGVMVALSILSKLLGVTLLVPIGLLMAARLWLGAPPVGAADQGTHKRRPYAAALAGIAAFALTGALLLLPFAGAATAFVSSVITFHTGAAGEFSQAGNAALIWSGLQSLLAVAALYGGVVALLRRDWRVLPLLAWLLVSVYLLWRQVPLFEHHLVSLVPPLIALAVMGVAFPSPGQQAPAKGRWRGMAQPLLAGLAAVSVVLLLLTAAAGLSQDTTYYRTAQARSVDGLAQLEARVASDLRAAISPGQQVVTDAQFVAGLASRDTPPALVDTSMVRIDTGNLTLPQLESIASQPQVHAVLFFSGRFYLPAVAAFHAWVEQHFSHLLHDYGGGRELWVR
jgi:4-amino-4-deoxy-L-arabinose transferase-like glycosyltransferase